MIFIRKNKISGGRFGLAFCLLAWWALALTDPAQGQPAQKNVARQAASAPAPASAPAAAAGRTPDDTEPLVLQSKLVALESGFFEAWKTGHAEYFDQHIVSGGIFFGQYGVSDKADEVASQRQSVGHCEVTSYALSNFRLVLASQEMAILTYRAEQHGTCYGATIDPYMNGLSVYVLGDGKWVNAVRSEVPAKDWPAN